MVLNLWGAGNALAHLVYHIFTWYIFLKKKKKKKKSFLLMVSGDVLHECLAVPPSWSGKMEHCRWVLWHITFWGTSCCLQLLGLYCNQTYIAARLYSYQASQLGGVSRVLLITACQHNSYIDDTIVALPYIWGVGRKWGDTDSWPMV